MIKKTYLLLARHGAKEHGTENLQDAQFPLKKRGEDVHEVASRLAEHLNLYIENEPVVLGAVWYGAHRAVRETTGIYQKQLELYGLKPENFELKTELSPENFWPGPAEERVARLESLVCALLEELRSFSVESSTAEQRPNGLLIIGHQPQLGWIAEQILGKPQPIDRAGVVCLEINTIPSRKQTDSFRVKARLLWVIFPSDAQSEARLREKIQSKMQLASVLNGVLTLILGILLGSLLDPEKFKHLDGTARAGVYTATVALVAGLILSLATVYAYDRLLMPVNFWGEKVSIKDRPWLARRPPGPAIWVMYQNMTRIWDGLFTPATWSVLFGIMLLALVLFRSGGILLAVIFSLLMAAGLFLYRHFRPVLGTED